MVLVALDPSFSCSGVSIIDTENKVITLAEIKCRMGSTFQESFNSSINIVTRIMKLLKDYEDKIIILSEEPFPNQMASSGLYQLDSLIFFNLITLKSFNTIYNIHPNFLKKIHNKKSYKKSESTELAKEFLDIFLHNDFTCNKTKFNNNVAEAFIYACKLYCKMSTTNEITKSLYKIKPCLKDDKEKLLYKK